MLHILVGMSGMVRDFITLLRMNFQFWNFLFNIFRLQVTETAELKTVDEGALLYLSLFFFLDLVGFDYYWGRDSTNNMSFKILKHS